MLTQPTPLPSNPFGSDPFSQPYLAYKKCHDLESLAHTDQSLQKCSPPGLVAARLLGHLLVYSENGRETLAGDITDAPDNATLLSMAQHYIIYFVNIFIRRSEQTPAPSNHPSWASFEDGCESLASINDPGSLNHSKAKLAALHRDSYRCPVTGLYDLESVGSGLVQLPAGERAWYTEAVHIIPDSTNSGIDENKCKAHQSAGVWAVLSMFSSNPVELHEKLNGNEIHQLENIITLADDIHRAFNDLLLWFKPVDDSPNTYKIYIRDSCLKISRLQLPEVITFTTTDRQLQVPSPYYLELHALCCEVSDLSGAGDYLSLVEYELEGMEA